MRYKKYAQKKRIIDYKSNLNNWILTDEDGNEIVVQKRKNRNSHYGKIAKITYKGMHGTRSSLKPGKNINVIEVRKKGVRITGMAPTPPKPTKPVPPKGIKKRKYING